MIYVPNKELHLLVSFDCLQAASPPDNPNHLFYLLERVSAHLPFICGLGIAIGHPATQPEFEHPTAGHQSSAPDAPTAVCENRNTGKRVNRKKSREVIIEYI
jgi:hypothetical protein